QMIFIQGNQYQYIEHPAIGGKAKNLLKLGQLGLHVPKWAVMPADFLAEVFKDVSSIERTTDVLHAIDRYVFPPVVQAELNTQFAEVTYLAVRSSALDEDGRQHSFAGQFESYLYVKKEQVLERIRSEEHTSELQSRENLVCRLLLEKKKAVIETLQR